MSRVQDPRHEPGAGAPGGHRVRAGWMHGSGAPTGFRGHHRMGGRGRGPWSGFGPMHGGRARRGDMQAAILALLAEQPMHGYQVIGELAERSGGAWNPGPGSVYPTLQAMEDQELIAGEQVGSKRVFSLTDAGRAALAQHADDRERMPWEQMAQASGPRVALRQAVGALFAATAQIERTGSDAQVEQAAALVDQARKALYLLLAE